MRLHVVSLPHTNTTEDFSACAYTEKVRKFCIMMKALGHTVFLYAGEANTAPVDELIPCITEAERLEVLGSRHYTEDVSFNPTDRNWKIFNARAIGGIAARLEPRDFICLIGGVCHKIIGDAFPNNITVEFGVGYTGVFAKYRVWESYAWMHTVYGSWHPFEAQKADGVWFDEVIPGYYDPAQFPFYKQRDDYFLYIGRMIDRKGMQIAADVCKARGLKLKLAGFGTPPNYGQYLGVVGPEERGKLMGRARAVFVPTQYIEPFGNVAVEAMACGTPVISTDWGAFTETVPEGIAGYRCRSMAEFCLATEKVDSLDKAAIRDWARSNFSLDVVGLRYEAYFRRLESLWEDGWYQKEAA